MSSGIVKNRAASGDMHEIHQISEEMALVKTRFLGAAGHDLRQPLAAANLFIDALKLTDPTPRQSEIIDRLGQSMDTFNGLIEALLNVSKLDSGVINPEYAPVSVAELFAWLDDNFASKAKAKHIGFKLHFPMKEALFIRSDIALIHSILMNLVSNAIKFTHKGAILISARRRKTEVLFQVWDSGMGIPKEYWDSIFDEFYKIENPLHIGARGLGLGLSIVKRELALLGAKIACRSQSGRGSVFEFRIPLAAIPTRASHPAMPHHEMLPDGSFARGKRFVVVEDDALIGQAMMSLLQGMGGEVHCFNSAEDALLHANIEHADYFISDHMLGGNMTGMQLLNQLRQKRGSTINAVLMTGDTSSSFFVELTDCAWAVLHKPIKLPDLFSVLRAQEA
jgi:CheY-like chemotaxis protein/two-component sensor histidine kinase